MTTTTIAQRLFALVASVAITFTVLSGVAGYAKPPAANPLLAQAAAAGSVAR